MFQDPLFQLKIIVDLWTYFKSFLKTRPIRLHSPTFNFCRRVVERVDSLFLFYKNKFYENIEVEICEILRIFQEETKG